MKKNMLKATCLIIAILSIITSLSLSAFAASYSVVKPAEGDYFICASGNNSYCIDVTGGSTARTTYVQLYTRSNGNSAQIFTLDHISGDWYIIRNKASGLVLNVPNANSQNGQKLWMYDYDGTDACLWRFADAGNGRYLIQNKLGRVIDLDNNLLFNGSRIHLWNVHDGASAKWKLVSASSGGNASSSSSSLSKAVSAISSKLPIVTYAMPKSGASRVYSYSNSSLSSKTTGYYIDTFYDQIVITSISSDGRSVYVKYPTATSYRSRWFATEDILGISSAEITSYTASGSSSTYRMSSSSGVRSYGSIAKNDSCTSLGTHKVGNKTYYPTVYPISRSTYNGVSGVRYKLALATSVGSSSSGSTSDTSSSSGFVSQSEISAAASAYGISTGSNAYKALLSINTKYANKLTSSQKKGTLVFMFEGVGSNSSSSKRLNAMCVVVKNGDIVYINRNSSTIPDYPFDPSKNGGTDMPTVKSGIYSFTTTNHQSKYAALNVTNASVLRFKSKSSYYSSTSYGINVHRRSSNEIPSSSAGWVNSAGCIIIGRTGTSSSSEYADFIQAVGIVSSTASATAKYAYRVSGKIIIDRAYASSYLSNVGYSSSAIRSLG